LTISLPTMRDSVLSKILSKLIIAIAIVALADLVYLNWWIVQNQNSNLSGQNLEATRDVSIESSPLVLPSPTTAVFPEPAKEPETKTVVEKQTQTIIQTAQKEIFIPIGSGSTNSNSYEDLPGLEVTIDTSKYSEIESVVFEASLRVEGGNGRAYAQLKNVSDNNPFFESMISSSSGAGEVKISGNIPIPSGSKKYGVRAKTDITNFAAHVENARIKITLK
jgi:hypothetical protein